MLVAGGDTGGKLGGIINLATSTVSSASSQIFNTATNTFLLVRLAQHGARIGGGSGTAQ